MTPRLRCLATGAAAAAPAAGIAERWRGEIVRG